MCLPLREWGVTLFYCHFSGKRASGQAETMNGIRQRAHPRGKLQSFLIFDERN